MTDILQGKISIAEASWSFDLPPSEIEECVEEDGRVMENALWAKPLDAKEQYERQPKERQILHLTIGQSIMKKGG